MNALCFLYCCDRLYRVTLRYISRHRFSHPVGEKICKGEVGRRTFVKKIERLNRGFQNLYSLIDQIERGRVSVSFYVGSQDGQIGIRQHLFGILIALPHPFSQFYLLFSRQAFYICHLSVKILCTDVKHSSPPLI